MLRPALSTVSGNIKFIIVFLFIFLSLGASPTKAQIILSESFENTFPPPGWSVVHTGFGNDWILLPTGYALSGTKCMQYPSNSSFAASAWIFSPGFTLSPGITYRLSYWYREAIDGKTEKMKVTLGNNASIASQTTILHDYASISNTTYVEGIDDFTVPSSGNYNFAFYCYSNAQTISALIIDSVVFEQVTAVNCSGTPPKGIVAAPSSACVNHSFTLSLNGVFTASGLTFQWQSSPTLTNNFKDIAGATTVTYGTVQAASTDYRCIVTCSSSGLKSTSDTATVHTPAICYCTPPSSNCSIQDVISNVRFGSINNASLCSPAGYADYTLTVPPATVAAGTAVPASISVGSGGDEYVAVWIDYNKNGAFDNNEFTALGNGQGTTVSNSINIPINAVIGTTLMRVRIRELVPIANTDACSEFILGETEDYAVTITPYVCTGKPTAGSINAVSTTCSKDSFSLNMSGTYTGLTLQWQLSPAGQNNFTSIPGGTTQTIKTIQATSKDYRCIVTCGASGLSDTSVIKSVFTPAFCYCYPPAAACNQYFNITKVVFAGINNSSTCTGSGYTDYTTTLPAASVKAGTTVPIAVSFSGGATSSAGVWIDYNHNGSFDPSEFSLIGPTNEATAIDSILVPATAQSGSTTMRIRRKANSQLSATEACAEITNGETEDYSITISDAHVAIYFTPFTDTLYDPVIKLTARIKQNDVGLNNSDSLKPRIWVKN